MLSWAAISVQQAFDQPSSAQAACIFIGCTFVWGSLQQPVMQAALNG